MEFGFLDFRCGLFVGGVWLSDFGFCVGLVM